jgi:hypothetical protein
MMHGCGQLYKGLWKSLGPLPAFAPPWPESWFRGILEIRQADGVVCLMQPQRGPVLSGVSMTLE